MWGLRACCASLYALIDYQNFHNSNPKTLSSFIAVSTSFHNSLVAMDSFAQEWQNTTSDVRGRQRRRARRYARVSPECDANESLTIPRGRSRRRAKRQTRQNCLDNGLPRVTRLLSPTTQRQLPTAKNLADPDSSNGPGKHRISQSISAKMNKSEPDIILPGWLLDGGSREPAAFRQISRYLRSHGDQKNCLLDKWTTTAIKAVGGEDCNKLLIMILLQPGRHVKLTLAGALDIMSWISLEALDRLRFLVSIPLSQSVQMHASIKNYHHGAEIFTNIMGHFKEPMNDVMFNNLLRGCFRKLSLWEMVPGDTRPQKSTSGSRWEQITEMLLSKYHDHNVLTGTIIVAYEIGTVTFPFMSRLISQCHHVDTAVLNFATSRRDDAPDIRSDMLARWPRLAHSNEQIFKILGPILLQQHILFLGESPIQPRESPEFAIIKDTTIDPGLFINLANCGPKAPHLLREAGVRIGTSELAAYFALSMFSRKECEAHLSMNLPNIDEMTLIAAMERSQSSETSYQKRYRGTSTSNDSWNWTSRKTVTKKDPFKSRMVRLIVNSIVPTFLTERTLQTAAQNLSSSSFRHVLSKHSDDSITPTIFIATLRSNGPVVSKIKSLLGRLGTLPIKTPSNFWEALIATNHYSLPRVLNLIRKPLAMRTTNSILVAASRTSKASNIVRLLLSDPGFTITAHTFAALLKESWKTEKVFAYILRKARNVQVDSSLVVESLTVSSNLKTLLWKHGAPWKLFIGESLFFSWWTNTANRHLCRLDALYYLRDSGVQFELSELVIECLLQEFELSELLALFQDRWSVEPKALYHAIGAARASYVARYTYDLGTIRNDSLEDVLDILLKTGPPRLDVTILKVFGPRVPGYSDDTPDNFPKIYEIIVDILVRGELEKFTTIMTRLPETHLPPAVIDWLVASVVKGKYQRNRLLDEPKTHTLTDHEIFRQVALYSNNLLLSDSFFDVLHHIQPNILAAEDGILKAWMALLSSPFEVEWKSSSLAAIFSYFPPAIVIPVMEKIDFDPCNEVVIAAAGSSHAMMKLELIFLHNREVEISLAAIEASIQSCNLDALDFLWARSGQLQITDELFRKAVMAQEPDDWGVMRDTYRQDSIISFLILAAPDVKPSQQTLELAILHLDAHLAKLLLRHPLIEALETSFVSAMLEKGWTAHSIFDELNRFPTGLDLLDDVQIHERLMHTEDGRTLLRCYNSGTRKCEELLRNYWFHALDKPDSYSSYCFLYDYLDKAAEMHLDDETIALFWNKNSESLYERALFHAVERGATGRIGVATFNKLCSAIKNRVIFKLPALPIDITYNLICDASVSFNRVALDCILGPDHEPIIHEDALEACAQFGEEVWFFRLLEIARQQSLVITNKDILIEAAGMQSCKSIREVCKLLNEGEPISFQGTIPRKSVPQIRKEILHREHYFARQRLRNGRPRVPRIFRRGFDRYTCRLKRRSYDDMRIPTARHVRFRICRQPPPHVLATETEGVQYDDLSGRKTKSTRKFQSHLEEDEEDGEDDDEDDGEEEDDDKEDGKKVNWMWAHIINRGPPD
ncbi:unnamed protein product [Periconia digitata]|uniref:Uncharacterized protein n=1 Tax=Periconia digitata TaxID=1303443 RepID=A0A9W4UR63_9PLEO|nr:unnamed protein product [Periconia digitata]